MLTILAILQYGSALLLLLLSVVISYQWSRGGWKYSVAPPDFWLFKIFSVGKFLFRMQNLGLETFILGIFRDKIELLSTRNLLYQKFATSCPMHLLFKPTTPLLLTRYDRPNEWMAVQAYCYWCYVKRFLVCYWNKIMFIRTRSLSNAFR